MIAVLALACAENDPPSPRALPGDIDGDGVPDSADTAYDTGPWDTADTAGDCVPTGVEDGNCDGVDDDCDGLVDGGHRVPEDYATIAEALRRDDTVLVCLAAGTHEGPVSIGGPAVIQGAGEGLSIVEGGGPVVLMFGGGELRDLTVTGGAAEIGAGVRVDGGDNRLSRVRISGNQCVEGGSFCLGAGLAVMGGSLAVESVTIDGNTGAAASTGSVLGLGAYVGGGTVTGTGLAVMENTLAVDGEVDEIDVFGGALAVTGLGRVVLSDSSFSSTTVTGAASAWGAGVYVELSNLDFTRAWISGNVAECAGGEGGGLFASSAAVTLSNVAVVQNELACTGTASGGGLGLTGASVVELQQSVIAANVLSGHVARGGGVYLDEGDTLSLVNSVLYANELLGTVSEGSAAAGAGSWTVSYTDLYANLPFDSVISGLAEPDDTSLSVDPLFAGVPPAEWDLRLATGSPLIDAGAPECVDVDGTRCDLGVFGGPNGSWP
ncbi:MAG: hypothetical protein FJ090_01290 [Deltaproteobacteria bacterium]|nr:hypothetical protein [Deltaproteobacteria bacterium]